MRRKMIKTGTLAQRIEAVMVLDAQHFDLWMKADDLNIDACAKIPVPAILYCKRKGETEVMGEASIENLFSLDVMRYGLKEAAYRREERMDALKLHREAQDKADIDSGAKAMRDEANRLSALAKAEWRAILDTPATTPEDALAKVAGLAAFESWDDECDGDTLDHCARRSLIRDIATLFPGRTLARKVAS